MQAEDGRGHHIQPISCVGKSQGGHPGNLPLNTLRLVVVGEETLVVEVDVQAGRLLGHSVERLEGGLLVLLATEEGEEFLRQINGASSSELMMSCLWA